MIKIKRPKLKASDFLAAVKSGAEASQELVDRFNRKESFEIKDDFYKPFGPFLKKVFHSKCAYCEAVISNVQPDEIEHFRPKGRLRDANGKPVKVVLDDGSEVDHPGYFWLAYEWSNLITSCIDCNRRRKHELPNGDAEKFGKADIFPVDGFRARMPFEHTKEKALLIDPTVDDPSKHLQFFKTGQIGALTKMGEQTIELLGLNKRNESIVSQRRKAYDHTYRVCEALQDAVSGDRTDEAAQLQEELKDMTRGDQGDQDFVAFRRLAFLDFRRKTEELKQRSMAIEESIL